MTVARRANHHSRFSLILLADTLWVSSAHDLLLSSLVRLLAHTPTARIAIYAGFHSGRRTVRQFLRKAALVGLVPPRGSSWQELGVDGRRRDWVLDPLPALPEEDASERNKWVVEGMLGWSDQALGGP